MAPGLLLQTVWQFSYTFLSRCQRFRFSSLQFQTLKRFSWSLERWGLFNCPQTSLYLLCKNYGVTIFKTYFSIHKKTFIFSQMDVVSLLTLSPQCLNLFFFFQFSPNPTSWYFGSLSCSGPFICTLEFFSCKFVQWKILFSLDRKHEELNKDSWNSDWRNYFCVKLFKNSVLYKRQKKFYVLDVNMRILL